jgi:4-diphosphocytidyl-2-C-methyl-D-erythritol kinase
LVNDFEDSVFARFPEIGVLKQRLYDKGAVYASMSGSGSSVFGIFGTPENLESEFPGSGVYACY